MDYFGGKLVSVDQQFGDLRTGIGNEKDQFRTLIAEVNALKTALSAAIKDNAPLRREWEADKHSIKRENGQIRNESQRYLRIC